MEKRGLPERVIRPAFKLVGDFQKNVIELIKNGQQENLSHLINKENLHVYEHGINMSFRNVDLEEQTSSLQSHEATTEIPLDRIANSDFSIFRNYVTQLVEGITSGVAKMFFERLTEATDKTGNVVDGKGKPLSGELILEALEKIEFSVDRQGQVSGPTLALSPALQEKAAAIQADPEFRKRLMELQERKIKQALAREAERLARFPKKGNPSGSS